MEDLETAVRLVLPSLNLDPDDFQLDPGFLSRAQKSGQPKTRALRGLDSVFIFWGFTESPISNAFVNELGTNAFAYLNDYVRQICKSIVVGWINRQDQAFAASFLVLLQGKQLQHTASSWIEPESWSQTMVDMRNPPDERVQIELTRLDFIVTNRQASSKAIFDKHFAETLKRVDIALHLFGGESQDISEVPSQQMSDESWADWLQKYNLLVRDEWQRVRPGGRFDILPDAKPLRNGPLAILKVFVSYARSQAFTMALPVVDALLSCGAEIWFDREQALDKQDLAIGLAETIGNCDVYILCASDELFERAGYAMQELAWAIQQSKSETTLKQCAVVKAPNTMLPTAVSHWPAIALEKNVPELLASSFAEQLQVKSAYSSSNLPTLSSVQRITEQHQIPPQEKLLLSPVADIDALRLRINHALLLKEIDQTSIENLLYGKQPTQQTEIVHQRILNLGEGLDWDGTLQCMGKWPADPFVHDIRFRFGCVRILTLTRDRLSGNLSEAPSIASDLQFLATQPIPILDWPNAVGWDDSERRLALRYHLGILRILKQLLRSGPTSDLLSIPNGTLGEWENELTMRRQECIDALLNLRLNGRIGWQITPPDWYGLFRDWSRVFKETIGKWRGRVPIPVIHQLAIHGKLVAATATQVTWHASRFSGLSTQYIENLPVSSMPSQQTTIQVYVVRPGEIDTTVNTTRNQIQLGLIAYSQRAAELQITWNGTIFSKDLPVGIYAEPSPDYLSRSISFANN